MKNRPILTTETEIREHLLVMHLKNYVQEKLGGKFLSSEKICAGVKNFYGKKLTSTYDFPNGYTICLC
jgi:hypothetical protein